MTFYPIVVLYELYAFLKVKHKLHWPYPVLVEIFFGLFVGHFICI